MRLRKKIRELEERIKKLEEKNKVLEFINKGKTFHWMPCIIFQDLFTFASKISGIMVRYVNETKTKIIEEKIYPVGLMLKENGKYLECYNTENEITNVYSVKDDNLVEVDLELYRKAMEI